MRGVYVLYAGLTATAALMLAGAGAFSVAAEQAASQPPRITEIKHIMKGIHQPHCGGIADLLKGEGPADDQAWQQLALHAALLNESGHLLMENDRCPSKAWAEATGTLRAGASAVFSAAGQKDLDAVRVAFKQVTASCRSCHSVHRNPLPERFAAVAAIMQGINQPHCAAIGKTLRGDEPAPDAWKEVLASAALINEAGHLLMQNERCPDAVWSGAAAALRTASRKLALAARAQSLEGANRAFGELTKACAQCHKAHKK